MNDEVFPHLPSFLFIFCLTNLHNSLQNCLSGSDKLCRLRIVHAVCALLAKFWRISLYLTDDAYCKALCDVKFRHIEGYGRKFRHIELSNSVIS